LSRLYNKIYLKNKNFYFSNFNSALNSKTLEINKEKLREKISHSLNLVVKKLRPRYILTSVEDFFFERTPFLNSDKYLTRLINLAYFPSEIKKNLKEKFLYAINLKPYKKMNKVEFEDLQKTLNTTEHTNDMFKEISNDLTELILNSTKYADKKYKISKDELYIGNLDQRVGYDQIFDFLSQFGELEFLNLVYDKRNRFMGHAFARFKDISIHTKLIAKTNEYSLNGRKVIIGEKVEKQVSIEEIEKRCWFCYNNPNIDFDLIMKELKNFYLAYPKGPVDDFHFLLLPKGHIKSFLDLNSTQKEEFASILKTIITLLKDNNLEYFIYEKNLPYNDEAARHMIINIVGISKEYSFSVLDHIYSVLSENNLKFLEFDASQSLSSFASKEMHYYYMDVPTGIQFGRSGVRTKILIDVEGRTKDYLDYPRKILCNLFDKEEKMNWKNCEVNKEFLVKLKDKLFKYFN
jgi:hypothetical protein